MYVVCCHMIGRSVLRKQIRMHYRSGTGGTLLLVVDQTLCVNSPGGSTIQREVASWPALNWVWLVHMKSPWMWFGLFN